jgi:hypothetical protein
LIVVTSAYPDSLQNYFAFVATTAVLINSSKFSN